jgi:hypothetical protein
MERRKVSQPLLLAIPCYSNNQPSKPQSRQQVTNLPPAPSLDASYSSISFPHRSKSIKAFETIFKWCQVRCGHSEFGDGQFCLAEFSSDYW